MRAIKFRAWDHQSQQMVASDLVAQVPLDDAMDNGAVLMQYTGVEDKNGVEIYEGDIVANGHDKGKVVFRYGAYEATWRHRDYNPHLDVWIENGRAQIQVIGNIYENPELLEQAA
ncbi:putative phage protein (TIGR01671 family) [Pseudarthrobacter oxydans]|uniref:Phage protein (TIGR01671 family) n=1 Tax=Pseudarthrobacter oxydans TaxID=1671 RepID=A0AAW8NJB0_PSEOX|nr:YopX family protein [Pseudarthrobacter oxydans]MDR6794710.1 putative phage protein (TIGR01671 family) [Pseudarthrobacter oxydans]MDR7166088.1 putative phage protein (TIGR01671 family) [Pseudarthrobacter oxydans]